MVFAGWYTGFGYIYNDGETVKNLITEGEIILTANWMEEEYVTTISFDANGGVGDIPNLTLFGEAINDLDRLPVVTKEGYTFVNWTYNDEPVTIYSEFIGIREVTFVANWHANNYVIKFDANGGDKTMSNLEMTYDITKNLTANNFTKDGYRFIGWSKEKDGKVDYQDKEAVKNLAFDSEVTLYAVWELIPIIEGNISFNPNGGVGDMMYIDAGESVNLPSCAFSYPGYHFIGWSKEKDGKVIYTDLQKNITDLNKETVLYAKWEKNNTDTISYIDNSFVQKADESLSITDYVKNLNANEEISILNRQGQKTTSGIIGTGFILQIRKDGKLISSKVIIVKGDVTGDGTSNIADVKKIADYTLTGDGLEYYDIYAAEVTNNITINIADVKRIADHTLNKEIDLWK